MNPHGPKPAWTALYQAYKTAPQRSKLWTPKWLSGWVPIGAKMKQWKLSMTDGCPRCREPKKHRHHVLRCTQEAAQHQWQAAINSLDRWLTTNHTQQELHIGIITSLTAWYTYGTTPTVTSDWPGVTRTLQEQEAMGWNKFVDGFIVESWLEMQQSYLEFINEKTTGK
jgi:hypothetical protein